MKDNGVTIIAEAGVNHNGDIELAKKLIDVAADAGADFVKFQSFNADKLVSKQAKKAAYQATNTADSKDDGQYNMLKSLELSYEMHLQLIHYCKQAGIQFLSTPFDEERADMLEKLDIALFKIPSGELTNKPFLQHLASKKKPIILSTGMSTLADIQDAIIVLNEAGLPLELLHILHCNTQYPTSMEDVNLKAMNTIEQAFGVKIGYSDHTLGIEVPIAAVAMGAKVIEKHFTLDRNMPGPDHKASLEPEELKNMVHSIRNIEKALGSPLKKPSPSEVPNIQIARKSIHLSIDKKAGEIIKFSDLIMLRPGDGISPMQIEHVINRKIGRDLPAGHKLDWKNFS
ncbi:N-acetylneuraminate synthase [Catalinimonas sp. 4WD22]|uniref:N-acetylneuraminate synthase n=1 Tax=Catalinimonas locisalis TaxID=3133978 RepID=UPI0031017103